MAQKRFRANVHQTFIIHVRAKNGFGAYGSTEITCFIDDQGKFDEFATYSRMVDDQRARERN